MPKDHHGNVHGIQVFIEIEIDVGTGNGSVRLLLEVGSQNGRHSSCTPLSISFVAVQRL